MKYTLLDSDWLRAMQFKWHKTSNTSAKSVKPVQRFPKLVRRNSENCNGFWRHPRCSKNYQSWPKIFQRLPKSAEDHPKTSKDYRQLPKDFRRLQKISEGCRRWTENFQTFSEGLLWTFSEIFKRFFIGPWYFGCFMIRSFNSLVKFFMYVVNISNHMVFLIQFGINLHSWVFQKSWIALASGSCSFWDFWKTHSCKLFPNQTWNRMI